MKRKKIYLNSVWVIALIGIMWGCYPAGPEYVQDLDIVFTTVDENFDFQTKNTYARPDSIVVDITIDRNGDTTWVYMKKKYTDLIFARIDQNMQNYGWTKVDIDESPDMLLMPAGTSSTNYYYSYWYDWWYGGWYGGWYGWYYPPYYTVSSYTTGTLIMVLTDPNTDTPINKSTASWIAVGNGILNYSNDIGRVTDAIDQSFIQSPYLKIN